MNTIRLGRIVNTSRYEINSLRKAVDKFNTLPTNWRRGEDMWAGYDLPTDNYDARLARVRTIDHFNVVMTDLTIREENEVFYLYGNTTSKFVSLVAERAVYGFGIRAITTPGPPMRGPTGIIEIVTVDLVGATDEHTPTNNPVFKGIYPMSSNEKESEQNLVTFPIVLTNQYSKESLDRAVEAWNNKPMAERWGEDRLGGYNMPVSELAHPDPKHALLENVCITKEKDGYFVTAADVGRIPVQLLARPYGHEFAIRGTAAMSPEGKQLIDIISIDLVRTKELFTVTEVVSKVLEWSTDRKILTNGKVASQASKYYEEAGEMAAGICKSKRPLVVDSIGDALVVLTNVMGIAKRDLRIHLHRVLDEVGSEPRTILSDDPHELLAMHMESMSQVLSVFRTHSGRLAERLAKDNLNIALLCLWDLARLYETTVDECMSDAWHEIKDRRGFLSADGVFVKEGDA